MSNYQKDAWAQITECAISRGFTGEEWAVKKAQLYKALWALLSGEKDECQGMEAMNTSATEEEMKCQLKCQP